MHLRTFEICVFNSNDDKRMQSIYSIKTYVYGTSKDIRNKIYVNIIENGITFKVNAGHYLELLTPETMNLPGSIKNETTKINQY